MHDTAAQAISSVTPGTEQNAWQILGAKLDELVASGRIPPELLSELEEGRVKCHAVLDMVSSKELSGKECGHGGGAPTKRHRTSLDASVGAE